MGNGEVISFASAIEIQMLDIHNYTYELPPERIALHPLPNRDDAKLLLYHNRSISHQHFRDLPGLLPADSFLFFNDTRVIPARLYFRKDTGADIEIFLLNPILPSTVVAVAMESQSSCSWKCTIGNLKRWPQGTTLTKSTGDGLLRATLRDKKEAVVEFEWDNGESFATIIDKNGHVPLPPYLKRDVTDDDKGRYQTVYSHHEGAVAAPTAGLHFTPGVLDRLKEKNIPSDFLTLHVGAGTFQPIKNNNAGEHLMHAEQVIVSQRNLDNLLSAQRVVPVGTTSMRTLESVYWYGVNLLAGNDVPFVITQRMPYELPQDVAVSEAIRAVKEKLHRSGADTLTGTTSIFIRPGYRFRVCQGLITNFHQPASTLILLVAAFVGSDWKRIYDTALNNDYRFLSYGDSSLLLP